VTLTCQKIGKLIVFSFLFFRITGCAVNPEGTLEEYLDAAVSRDTVRVRQLSCEEEIPQLLSWQIVYRAPAQVTSHHFLEEMETIRVTIDTLQSRCDSLKNFLLEDCVDIEDGQLREFVTELEKVTGATDLQGETGTSPVQTMAGHLRFPTRKSGSSDSDEYEYLLPTGDWVGPREALLFCWDGGAFTYHNNRQIVDILTIRLSGLQFMKSDLECALGRSVSFDEDPLIEKAQFVLDLTYVGAALGKLVKKQRAVLLRANKGRWVVTGLEEL